MTERPILFSAPMVRALLAGTKTQTRRVVKPPEGYVGPDAMRSWGCNWDTQQECPVWMVHLRADIAAPKHRWIRCPYGKPSDRLWVREAWRTVVEADKTPPRDMDPAYRLWFEADAPHQEGFGKYRPPMFMPRWASRITLEVTGVRVERLQDISKADALAEGANVHPDHHNKPRSSIYSPVQAYRDLWESINGPGSWDANPWVWVVEFRRV